MRLYPWGAIEDESWRNLSTIRARDCRKIDEELLLDEVPHVSLAVVRHWGSSADTGGRQATCAFGGSGVGAIV